MVKEMLSHLHWSALPIFSMMMFLAVFIGVVLWVYRKSSQKDYAEISQYPLDSNLTLKSSVKGHRI